MNLFAYLAHCDPRVTVESSKVHLAGWNGTEDPLRVYFEGRFDDRQSRQTKRNFGRSFVVSLVQLSERNRWLYVGTYAVEGCEWNDETGAFRYRLDPIASCGEWSGRLVVDFARPGRQSYLLAASSADRMSLFELKPEPMHLADFPGFKQVDLEWPDLEIVFRQRITSWRTALSNVAGVYLLSDPGTGKLYVGSATGEGGIWLRWSQYLDGHGNNVELAKLIGVEGLQRARTFRFSILEIADVHASHDEILERESHWKRILLTRTHGYNAN